MARFVASLVALMGVAALLPAGASSGEPEAPGLVRDIAVEASTAFPEEILVPFPVHFVELEGRLYFNGWEPTHGIELWVTDGTAEGTEVLKDICPGSCSGRVGSVELVVSGGLLYFLADDGEHGSELWVSDGTREGTRMVLDIRPGPGYSRPWYLTPAANGIYFTADDGEHGRELWFSDGTAEGTAMVDDVRPGPVGADPTHLVAFGDLLFFSADDGVNGREPWVTDGTPEGTAMILDIRPGPEGSMLEENNPWPSSIWRPVVLGDAVYFRADDGIHGRELWRTDGTADGTFMVADVSPGPGSGFSGGLFPFGDVLLFRGTESGEWPFTLWRTDGTAQGTYSLGTAANGSHELNPWHFAALGEHAYFAGFQEATGRELWRTDGTVEGTEMVLELAPGEADGAAGGFVPPTVAAGGVYFLGSDGQSNFGLWRSDGTPAGTAPVDAGPADVWIAVPAALGDAVLYFSRDDESGWALRRTEGVPGDGALVRRLDSAPSSIPLCLWGTCPGLVPTEAGVLFPAWELAHGVEPWESDGSHGGTRRLADLAPGPASSLPWSLFSSPMAALGERVLLVANDDPEGWRSRLWVLEAGAPPMLLVDEHCDFGGAGLLVWGDVALADHCGTLWITDGTPEGTEALGPGAGEWGYAEFALAGDRVFYVSGGRLWVTDGTPAGTVSVAPGLQIGPSQLTPVADGQGGYRLFFIGQDAAAGRELWVSDGTAAGTYRVVDLHPGPADGVADWIHPVLAPPQGATLAALGTRAAFAGNDGALGEELWVSDGTEAGTIPLEIRPGPEGSRPRSLTVVDGVLYFSADDGIHGRELWRSDGTPKGTYLVADIAPGAAPSTPHALTDAGGILAFAADDGAHGVELWASDGSARGTSMVADIHPGPSASSPQGLTWSAGRLFFYADDGIHGLELWAWPPVPAHLFADGFESGDFSAWSAAAPPPP
jgi:ELWxxDGT repeat protein